MNSTTAQRIRVCSNCSMPTEQTEIREGGSATRMYIYMCINCGVCVCVCVICCLSFQQSCLAGVCGVSGRQCVVVYCRLEQGTVWCPTNNCQCASISVDLRTRPAHRPMSWTVPHCAARVSGTHSHTHMHIHTHTHTHTQTHKHTHTHTYVHI